MFEFLVLILFGWLFFGAVKLAFKAAWGLTKIIASVLLAVALPVLIGCLLFTGGLILLLPVLIIAAACGLLKVNN